MFKTIIPKISLEQLSKGSFDVTIKESKSEDGNISLVELFAINSLVKSRKVKTAFEIGTFNGRTALNIAANMLKNGKVFTLDLPKQSPIQTKFKINAQDKSGYKDSTYIKYKETGKLFKNKIEAKKIIQLLGDSGSFDFSPYKNKMNLVVIDGSHSYPYVKNDTEIALQIIKSSGIILWHDYGSWKDVTDYLNHLYKTKIKKLRHIEGTRLVIQI